MEPTKELGSTKHLGDKVIAELQSKAFILIKGNICH